jgi:hypothetical protein
LLGGLTGGGEENDHEAQDNRDKACAQIQLGSWMNKRGGIDSQNKGASDDEKYFAHVPIVQKVRQNGNGD